MSLKAGLFAEQQACKYLTARGLHPVASNYRSRAGEIDLIMRDSEYLVFIEVRARASMLFGGAVASVTLAKQRKIMKTALLYLQMHRLQDKYPVRFDIVSLDGKPPVITWIRDAFGMDY